jgi:hypothetical protein
MTRLSSRQLKKLGIAKPKNKYNAKKTIVDGITFDSKKEAEKYQELKLLQRAGEVTDIQLQPEFDLVPGFEYRGKKIRGVKYTADFLVTLKNGRKQIIETKGYKTRDYVIRKKLLLLMLRDQKYVEFVEE